MAVDTTAAETHIPEIVTQYTLFLITRCLNGRKVACSRSKEITAMFDREVRGKKNLLQRYPPQLNLRLQYCNKSVPSLIVEK